MVTNIHCHMLLLVSSLNSMAQSFNFRSHQEVRVRVINEPVQGGICLDHLEIIFRDQYLRRSDMWRIKLQLLDNCAFAEMQVRCRDLRGYF